MRSDLLNNLIALKVIAEKKNFTSAANELGVSTSAVSQSIKQLEKKLSCTLINRTTRSLSLTEIGEKFLLQYKPALEQLLNAVDQVGSYSGKPSGLLRLNLPRASFPSVIEPIIIGFQKKYPEIKVELFFEDNLVDVVKDGFDAGIRLSELTAQDMIAVKISEPFSFFVAGSKEYFKTHGKPKHPKDLINHNCILYKFSNGSIYKRWEFESINGDINIEINGSTIINDPVILVELAKKGLGLIYHTEDMIKKSIQNNELEIVLEEFSPKSNGYYLYYPNYSQVSPKLRAFIDYTKELRNKSYF